MRKDTLYVSDLDGTLLDTTANISDNSRAMLAEAIHSGAMFTVATARTPATVHPIMAGLPSPAFTDTATGIRQALPAIVMTGAATWDRTLERYDTVRLIPAEYVAPILDAFGRAGLRPFTYCLSGERFLNVYHTRAMDRREETFYRERRHLQLKRFHLDQQPASPANVVLFFATGPDTQVEHACRLLNEATPCAAAWYRDIVTPSTTKYLDGHAAAVGGAIVDSGNFDWEAHKDKYPGLTTPDESYHGITYTQRFGLGGAFITKAVAQLMRDFGATPAPMNAWLLGMGAGVAPKSRMRPSPCGWRSTAPTHKGWRNSFRSMKKWPGCGMPGCLGTNTMTWPGSTCPTAAAGWCPSG